MVARIKNNAHFKMIEHSSIMQKFNEIQYSNYLLFDDPKLNFLKDQRSNHTKIFGELGNQMSDNAFLIYLELKKKYELIDDDNCYKEAMTYLLKASSYSLK